jgi:hypothetical protein
MCQAKANHVWEFWGKGSRESGNARIFAYLGSWIDDLAQTRQVGFWQLLLRYSEEIPMLHAVNSGKASRIRIEGLEQGISWRKVFKENEDPLTAVVFARLSYIPGEMAWRILRRNARSLHSIPDSLENQFDLRDL